MDAEIGKAGSGVGLLPHNDFLLGFGVGRTPHQKGKTSAPRIFLPLNQEKHHDVFKMVVVSGGAG